VTTERQGHPILHEGHTFSLLTVDDYGLLDSVLVRRRRCERLSSR